MMELNREERQKLHVAEAVLRCAIVQTGGLYALHITRKGNLQKSAFLYAKFGHITFQDVGSISTAY